MKKLLLVNHSKDTSEFIEVKDFYVDEVLNKITESETVLIFDVLIKPPLVTLAQVGVIIDKEKEFVMRKNPTMASGIVIKKYSEEFDFGPNGLMTFFVGESLKSRS